MADLLSGRQAQPAPLVDAATVAAHLGVSADYVYRHADRLGAVRLSKGKKPRPRFSLERAATSFSESLTSLAEEAPAIAWSSAPIRPRSKPRKRRNPPEPRLTYTPLDKEQR